MPPPGAPRPEPGDVRRARRVPRNAIDRDALRAPNPGKLPLLHRLSRTEYQNAIRDLLALDALPKEIDYSLLLPADNSASGFDNIADLLFVSPAIMERYLDAAEKISRLAVGDPNAPVMVNSYRLHRRAVAGRARGRTAVRHARRPGRRRATSPPTAST